MRSGTSYFNPTLYRKTMLRFWPLWALYGLLWLFALPLNLLNQYFYTQRWDSVSQAQQQLLDWARNIPDLLSGGVLVSFFFGAVCAMAVFGYLYSSRSACMMHALPMRREGLFTTQYLAGVSFFLLPHLAVAFLALAVELALLPPDSWACALPSLGLWLLVQSGTCLFFFSFASFCAMFTGHILALPAFYGILNFLVMVVSTLLAQLLSQFFYGYPARGWLGGSFVMYCTPVYALGDACDWNAATITVGEITSTTGEWYLASPATVAAYAAAGVVLAVLALMVYRYRHVESAGDVVSIALVRPVFKYGVALCAGLCFGTWTAAFFGWVDNTLSLSLTLCVLFWAAAGYFAAEMLLKKSFRVLRAWKGGVVTVAALAVLCACCAFDVFGVVNRVPDAQDVAALTVSGNLGGPYDSGTLQLSALNDTQKIALFTDLHRAIINERARTYNSRTYEPGDNYIYLELTYTLKNGSTLTREYHSVPIFQSEENQEGSVTWCASRINADRDITERSYNFDYYQQGRLVEAYLSGVYHYPSDGSGTEYAYQDIQNLDGAAGEDLAGLWQAVRADFADGTIGVRYLFDDQARLDHTYQTDLVFCFEMPKASAGKPASGTSVEFYITLTPEASRTLDWLERMGALGSQYALIPHDGSALSQADESAPAQTVS